MTLELINDANRFAVMRQSWNELLAASTAHSPFLTWEWLYAWWAHLGGGRALAILAVSDGPRLIGVAPLARSRDTLRVFPRWEFLGSGPVGSDYLDAIVREGYEAEAVHQMAAFLRGQGISLHLRHLPARSLMARLIPALVEHGWSTRTTADGVCPVIDLHDHTWDSFLATIGPAHRATTRRRLRTLERKFAMRFESITDGAALDAALAALFAFHDARFGNVGTAFHTPALRAFHRCACGYLLESGTLRMFELRLNDRLVAVMYGFAFKNRFFFYQHGYDSQYRSIGVGRAVLDLTIRAAIAEGLVEFDLLYGTESYKSAWTSASRSLVRIEGFPDRLAGRLQRQTVDTGRTLRALARRVIPAHVPQAS